MVNDELKRSIRRAIREELEARGAENTRKVPLNQTEELTAVIRQTVREEMDRLSDYQVAASQLANEKQTLPPRLLAILAKAVRGETVNDSELSPDDADRLGLERVWHTHSHLGSGYYYYYQFRFTQRGYFG